MSRRVVGGLVSLALCSTILISLKETNSKVYNLDDSLGEGVYFLFNALEVRLPDKEGICRYGGDNYNVDSKDGQSYAKNLGRPFQVEKEGRISIIAKPKSLVKKCQDYVKDNPITQLL